MNNKLIKLEQITSDIKQSGDLIAIAEGVSPEDFWNAWAEAWDKVDLTASQNRVKTPTAIAPPSDYPASRALPAGRRDFLKG